MVYGKVEGAGTNVEGELNNKNASIMHVSICTIGHSIPFADPCPESACIYFSFHHSVLLHGTLHTIQSSLQILAYDSIPWMWLSHPYISDFQILPF